MKIKLTSGAANRLGRRIGPKAFKAWLLSIKDQVSDGSVHRLSYRGTKLDIWVADDTMVIQ